MGHCWKEEPEAAQLGNLGDTYHESYLQHKEKDRASDKRKKKKRKIILVLAEEIKIFLCPENHTCT